ALEHNGDLYACDHFVYPEFRLGNLRDTPLAAMAGSPEQAAFGAAKRESLPAYCRECDVRFACNGECPKHRFLRTPDGEYGLNYLCAGYKAFFRHIGPHMRTMARLLHAGRAPAEIMSLLATEERQRAVRSAGRNDPCPCGSGRKYKLCCLAKA
ncbi:MAG TPA: SPASM domain-containing protein, partial [Chthonomonadaceae bacterium]|nr:SPASM domain-containing protein [Chthonomonadaceae bacterium]